MNNTTT